MIEPKQSEFCELVALLSKYLHEHDDGADRLKSFMAVDGLWGTEDVMEYTGWGRQYISKLCSAGQIPFIPGRPNKFIPIFVKQALVKMQIGAGYGRRKSKLKPKTTKKGEK